MGKYTKPLRDYNTVIVGRGRGLWENGTEDLLGWNGLTKTRLTFVCKVTFVTRGVSKSSQTREW